ncbi:MAG: HNH endonuclease [Candidatus Norongarragalinales archaeon]
MPKEEREKKLLEEIKKFAAKPLGESESIVKRRKRDYAIITKMKEYYEYKCQICGTTIPKKSGGFYIEAAHITPKREEGTEDPENLLILCPNHHKLLDYGEVKIEKREGNSRKITINNQEMTVKYKGYA